MFRLRSTRHLLLGIFDFIVIAVIIYGMTDWVYDGYPKWVPYVIMIFFFIMASIRFYKFSAHLKRSNSIDSHDLESLFSADYCDEDSSCDQVSAKGFRRRSTKSNTVESENSDN